MNPFESTQNVTLINGKNLTTEISMIEEKENKSFKILESYRSKSTKDHELRIISTEKEKLDFKIKTKIDIDNLNKLITKLKRQRNCSLIVNIILVAIIITLTVLYI